MKQRMLILVLSLVVLASGPAFAHFSVDSASGLNTEGLLEDGATLTIWIRMAHDYSDKGTADAIDNGFWLYDVPDGSLSWGDLDTALNTALLLPDKFDAGFYVKISNDTVGFGGANFFDPAGGIPYGFDEWAYQIIVGPITVNTEPEEQAQLWIDSSYYQPSNHWEWTVSLGGAFKPDWDGPYHWSVLPESDIGEPDIAGLPSEFGLRQNYPNPFNPSTIILYDIPRHSQVSLVVYNALGQKVRTLVDGMRGAGSYTVEWDGRNDGGTPVSTGVYLYRLEAGEYVQTKKAILMK